MKLISLLIFTVISISTLSAQNNSLNEENLRKIDALWEKSQVELDTVFLKSILAKKFIWVHNHASMIETKTSFLNRLKNANIQKKYSRNSSNIKVIIYEKTGIVSGFTIVNRGLKPIKYHFMRTYVNTNEKYYLLANHTMAIPEKK